MLDEMAARRVFIRVLQNCLFKTVGTPGKRGEAVYNTASRVEAKERRGASSSAESRQYTIVPPSATGARARARARSIET